MKSTMVKFSQQLEDNLPDVEELRNFVKGRIWKYLEATLMVRIFKHLARISGAKNVNEFVRKGGSAQIKLKQDEEIEAEVQKGNMRPI